MSVINATDLRIDFDSTSDRRAAETFILIGADGPWTMTEAAAAFLGMSPCTGCQGRKLRRKEYCLMCDRSGIDGVVVMPGLDVDQAPDPEWSPSPTVVPARGNLRGGV